MNIRYQTVHYKIIQKTSPQAIDKQQSNVKNHQLKLENKVCYLSQKLCRPYRGRRVCTRRLYNDRPHTSRLHNG